MAPRHPAFFVFGPERSGTTLLTFLLSGQPDCFVLNDSFVFDRYVEWSMLRRAPSGLSRPGWAARIARGLAPHLRLRSARDLRDWRRPYHEARARRALRCLPDETLTPECVRGYYDTLRTRYRLSLAHGRESFLNAYADALPEPRALAARDLLSHTLEALGRRFRTSAVRALGEKTPIHTLYARWILGLYPEAKAVLVVRRPVANVASILGRTGDFDRALATYGLYGRALLELADSDRVRVVRQEELVSDTPGTLEPLLRFLDPHLRFDPTCPVDSYTKLEYTGRAVDATRAAGAVDRLGPEQQRRVRRRFADIERRFYGGLSADADEVSG
jgi:hypothetical protein